MNTLIALQLPDELKTRVLDFQRKYRFEAPEPHIRLIGSRQMKDADGFEQKLDSFCIAQADFKIVVAGPRHYQSQLLYLSVLPGAITLVQNNLASHLHLPEDKVYRPHILLLRQRPDGIPYDFTALVKEAAAVFSQPCSFTASSLSVFTQLSPDDSYQLTSTIPFTGKVR